LLEHCTVGVTVALLPHTKPGQHDRHAVALVLPYDDEYRPGEHGVGYDDATPHQWPGGHMSPVALDDASSAMAAPTPPTNPASKPSVGAATVAPPRQ
jgi:hypothetical protein